MCECVNCEKKMKEVYVECIECGQEVCSERCLVEHIREHVE